MKPFLFAAFGLILTLNIFATNYPPVLKEINLSTSIVNWEGHKVLGKHNGIVNFKSGELLFDGDVLTGGNLVVNMESINCTDLSGGGKTKLEGHLKSDDFFGVSIYPTATINITKVVSTGKVGEYRVTANLKIKNKTNEIKFNATAINGNAKASLKIDRSEYDIKYGSGSFFDNLGDKTIYDEFDLEININY